MTFCERGHQRRQQPRDPSDCGALSLAPSAKDSLEVVWRSLGLGKDDLLVSPMSRKSA